jgi:hypothetical protein
MKRILLILALCAVAGTLFAAEFRNATWLMSKEEVVKSEPGLFVSELNLPGQQQIVFRALVNGITAIITYILENDKLISASYTFRRDLDRAAFDAMRKDLVGRDGDPAFEKDNILGWRLDRSEIALAHLRDNTTQVSYWEKSYFAKINRLSDSGSTAKN